MYIYIYIISNISYMLSTKTTLMVFSKYWPLQLFPSPAVEELRRFSLHWRCHAAVEGERASPEAEGDGALIDLDYRLVN